MHETIAARKLTPLVLGMALAAVGLARAAEPPKAQQSAPGRQISAADATKLRVSRSLRPTFRVVSAPMHDTLKFMGPDLVAIEPRFGTYVVGHVMAGGQAVDAWEIYWRAKNQGGKPVTVTTVMRATCTPMNVNPALPPQTKLLLNALMCEWLNTGENVPPPLDPGNITEVRSYVTYPSNVPCTAPHPRVTFKVDATNAVDEGPREGNNELTLDFCQ